MSNPINSLFSSFSQVTNKLFHQNPSILDRVQSSLKDYTLRTQEFAKEVFSSFEGELQDLKTSVVINRQYDIATNLEIGFNLAACVPFLGILSSSLRIVIGKAQIITAIALIAFGQLGSLTSNYRRCDSQIQHRWRMIVDLGCEHLIHGFLNINRGYVENTLSLGTLGLGNLLLLAPNMMKSERFTPVIGYGTFLKKV